MELTDGSDIDFTGSSSVFAHVGYAVHVSHANSSITANTSGYIFSKNSYIISTQNDVSASITLTKGNFASRNNRYLIRNKKVDGEPAQATTSSRPFRLIDSINSVTGKAVYKTEQVPDCYYLGKGV